MRGGISLFVHWHIVKVPGGFLLRLPVYAKRANSGTPVQVYKVPPLKRLINPYIFLYFLIRCYKGLAVFGGSGFTQRAQRTAKVICISKPDLHHCIDHNNHNKSAFHLYWNVAPNCILRSFTSSFRMTKQGGSCRGRKERSAKNRKVFFAFWNLIYHCIDHNNHNKSAFHLYSNYFTISNSTRRLTARPASVALSAMGTFSPKPT